MYIPHTWYYMLSRDNERERELRITFGSMEAFEIIINDCFSLSHFRYFHRSLGLDAGNASSVISIRFALRKKFCWMKKASIITQAQTFMNFFSHFINDDDYWLSSLHAHLALHLISLPFSSATRHSREHGMNESRKLLYFLYQKFIIKNYFSPLSSRSLSFSILRRENERKVLRRAFHNCCEKRGGMRERAWKKC